MRLFLIAIIISLTILNGCNSVEKSTNDNIVCNSPYIRFADSCCLDKDSNSICDVDEETTINEETEQDIEEETTINEETDLTLEQLEALILKEFEEDTAFTNRFENYKVKKPSLTINYSELTDSEKTFFDSYRTRNTIYKRFNIHIIKDENDFLNNFSDFETFVNNSYLWNKKAIDKYDFDLLENNSELYYLNPNEKKVTPIPERDLYGSLKDSKLESINITLADIISKDLLVQKHDFSISKVFFEEHYYVYYIPIDNPEFGVVEANLFVYCSPNWVIEIRPKQQNTGFGWSNAATSEEVEANAKLWLYRSKIELEETARRIIPLCE